MPLEGTNPFIGEAYNLEEVEEIRMRNCCKGSWFKRKLLIKVIAAHPYEEVAYMIFILLLNKGNIYGYGGVGKHW